MRGLEIKLESAEGREGIYWTEDMEDVVKEDLQRIGVTEEDARVRVRWREMITQYHL